MCFCTSALTFSNCAFAGKFPVSGLARIFEKVLAEERSAKTHFANRQQERRHVLSWKGNRAPLLAVFRKGMARLGYSKEELK